MGMRPANMFTMSSLSGGTTIQLPNPDTESGKNLIATLVHSGRNANEVVVAQKTELSWNYLEKDEWEKLLRFWDKNFFFTFTYYSRVEGRKISRKFYIGDRSDRPKDIDSNGIPTAYLDCAANVVDTGEGS